MKKPLTIVTCFSLAASAWAVPAGAKTVADTASYEKAVSCFKSVMAATLYERLLLESKGSKDASNEDTYSAWLASFRAIMGWEAKALGMTDEEMAEDIQATSDELRQQAVGSSSDKLVSLYTAAIAEANTCRDLY